MSDASPEKQYDSLRSAVDADITLAWTRKTSFETRALALVTLNFATATLFFLVNRELGYTTIGENSLARTALIVALCTAVASILGAGASLVLYNYQTLPSTSYDSALRAVDDPEPGDNIQAEVVEVRIGIYDSAVKSNRCKAFWVSVSMVAFVIAVVSYLAALLFSIPQA